MGLKYIFLALAAATGPVCEKRVSFFGKSDAAVYSDYVLGKYCPARAFFARIQTCDDALVEMQNRLPRPGLAETAERVFRTYGDRLANRTTATALDRALFFHADMDRYAEDTLRQLYFDQLRQIEVLAYTALREATRILEAAPDFRAEFARFQRTRAGLQRVVVAETERVHADYRALRARLVSESWIALTLLRKLHAVTPQSRKVLN